jgi:hypothetical protein
MHKYMHVCGAQGMYEQGQLGGQGDDEMPELSGNFGDEDGDGDEMPGLV